MWVQFGHAKSGGYGGVRFAAAEGEEAGRTQLYKSVSYYPENGWLGL